MITAILAARDQEAELALALAALVPAATEGLVRQAIVVDGGSRDGTIAVADAAGCTIVEGRGGEGLARAAAEARGDWLLFLSPGAQLEPLWQNEVVAFVDGTVLSGIGHKAAATFRLRLMDQGIAARIAEWTANANARLFSAPRKEQGLLISRVFYRALHGHRRGSEKPEADLARRIGRRRLTLLRSRALVRLAARPAVEASLKPTSTAVSSASDARPGAA